MSGPISRQNGNQNRGHHLPFHFRQEQGPKTLQGSFAVALFEPRDFSFDYKVIVKNKTESTKVIVQSHNGHGSQEAIFSDAKGDCGFNVIATRRLAGNQIYTLYAMMAYNGFTLTAFGPLWVVQAHPALKHLFFRTKLLLSVF